MPLHTRQSFVRSRRRAAFSLAAAVSAVLLAQAANATILTWDADPIVSTGPQDGSGTWTDLGLNNWWDGTGNVQWNSATPDSAVFGSASGPAATVTLGSNITVGNITFNPATSGNYTIAGGGGTLTLSSTTIGGTSSATISANLAGTTGLATTNSATIRLSGTNTYTGATSILNGTLQLDSVGALGGSTQITVGNSGAGTGSLLINVPDSTSTSVGAGRTATIFNSGVNNFGALRGADGASNTWAGNVVIGSTGSRISGGNAGTLTVTGVISGTNSILFSRNTNATTVLSAVNTYTGDTQIFNSVSGSTATLKIGIDNAINAGSRLSVIANVSAGAEIVDLNGHVLTFRTLDTSTTTTAASAANLMVTNNGAISSTLTVGDPTAANTGTFGGSVRNGTSTISLIKNGANTQVLAGANTYTGSTTINSGTLQLGAATPATNAHFLGSNAVLASTSYLLNGGTFSVNNVGLTNNNNDRLPDTADFTFGGSATFAYRGSDATTTNSSETIHNIALNAGNPVISVIPGGTNTATLSANQLTRAAAGGNALVNGVSLGSSNTSTARLLLATAPTLVGTTDALPTGINASAQNTKIVPFLLGEATTTTGGLGTGSGASNTFLTWEASTGLRPLNPTDEFTNNSIVAGNNTRITASTTSSTTAAINSLVMAGSVVTLTLSQPLTNTSGAILFTSNDTIAGSTLDFGSTEAIVSVNNTTGIISSRIAGTNGLTLYGSGTLGVGSPNSTYTGPTTVRSGTIVPQASSAGPGGAVTSGPFGLGTLVLAGGNIRATGSGPITIGNNISIQADAAIAAGGSTFTLSGGVTLVGGTRTITNSATSNTIFSGVIGDAGANLGLTLAGTGTGSVVLSGANIYTGSTTVLSSTLVVSGSLSGSATVGNSASLATAATLRGSGTLAALTALGSGDQATSGATVDPGNTANVAGILKTGAFSLTNGAHLNLQIGGTTAGGETTTGYDQLIASGAVSLTNGDLKLSVLGTPTFTLGDTLYLVVNNSSAAVTGAFSTINGSAFDPSNIVLGGQQFQLSYTSNFSGAGSDGIANDVALIAVPEPTAGVLMIGTMSLVGLTRRIRRR